jgi:hypothetical protein
MKNLKKNVLRYLKTRWGEEEGVIESFKIKGGPRREEPPILSSAYSVTCFK